MTTRMRFLGAAGFEIVGPQQRILIDPFLTGNPHAPVAAEDLETPDVILVTHAGFDHFGDAATIALRTGAPVVCDTASQSLLLEAGVPASQVRATIWGLRVRIAETTIIPVESRHWSIARLADGRVVTGFALAFIVETEPGVRIYHFGDTCLFDMRLLGEVHRPTVAILGPTVPYELMAGRPEFEGPGEFVSGEMTPAEAALAVEMLGVSFVVACHYVNRGDPALEEFARLVRESDPSGAKQVLTPSVGNTIVLTDAQCSIECD